MRKPRKSAAVLSAIGTCAVLVFGVGSAFADDQPTPNDVVGVGSDTVQYASDFLADGTRAVCRVTTRPSPTVTCPSSLPATATVAPCTTAQVRSSPATAAPTAPRRLCFVKVRSRSLGRTAPATASWR